MAKLLTLVTAAEYVRSASANRSRRLLAPSTGEQCNDNAPRLVFFSGFNNSIIQRPAYNRNSDSLIGVYLNRYQLLLVDLILSMLNLGQVANTFLLTSSKVLEKSATVVSIGLQP